MFFVSYSTFWDSLKKLKKVMQVICDIFKEYLTIFNKAIGNAKQAHFSKLISKKSL